MKPRTNRPYKSRLRSKTIPASVREALQPPHQRFKSNLYPFSIGNPHQFAPHIDGAITQVNLAPKTLAESFKQMAVAR